MPRAHAIAPAGEGRRALPPGGRKWAADSHPDRFAARGLNPPPPSSSPLPTDERYRSAPLPAVAARAIGRARAGPARRPPPRIRGRPGRAEGRGQSRSAADALSVEHDQHGERQARNGKGYFVCPAGCTHSSCGQQSWAFGGDRRCARTSPECARQPTPAHMAAVLCENWGSTTCFSPISLSRSSR